MKNSVKIVIWSIFIVIIVFVILFSINKKEEKTSSEEVVRIGAILPLTGKAAEWGERTKRGTELALEEVNKDKKIMEVLYEDSAANINQAVSEAHKLINVNKVQVLLCQLSGVCSALAPLAQENGVILFGFTDTPELTKVGDYVFNLRGSAIQAGESLGEFTVGDYKTVAIFYLNNPTQKGVYEGFKKVFEEQGGKVLLTGFHDDKDSDFRTVLSKAKEKKPEALVFLSRFKNVMDLVEQSHELNLEQPIISTLGIDTQTFLDGLGNLAEDIVYPTAIVSEKNIDPELQNTLEVYKEKYNEAMPIWAAESYDSIRLLGSIIKAGKQEAKTIRQALAKIKGFPGLASEIAFDQGRTILKDYHIFTIKNGQFVPYEE